MNKDPCEYLQIVYDESFVFLGLLDTDGMLLTANKALLSAMHLALEDIVGKPFPDAPWWAEDKEQRNRLWDAIHRAAAGEFVRTTMTHNWPNEPTRIVDFTLRPVRNDDGEVIYLIPEGRDVTDLKRAERARIEAYEFDQLLVDISSHFINITSDRIVAEIRRAQWAVAQILDMDHGALLQFKSDGKLTILTQWNRPDDEQRAIQEKDLDDFTWFPTLVADGNVRMVSAADIPDHARAERKFVEARGHLCHILVPLKAEGNILGSIGFSSFHHIAELTREQVERLGLFGDIVANALIRKKSDERLAESEQRFRLIAEHAKDVVAIYQLHPPGYVYVSPSSTRVLGYTPEEHDADPDITANCVHPEDRQMFRQFHSNPGAFDSPVTVRFHRKDGELIWLELQGTAQTDKYGDITHVQTISRDITERVTATARIREQDERMRGIAENLAMGICILNRELKIVELNPQMAEWFPEISTNTSAHCDVVCKEDICDCCPSSITFEDGEVHEATRRLKTAIGERTFRILACPIRNDAGVVTHAVELLEDITERQHLQQQMLQAQKLQAIGTLSGGIAHEINQPLSAIKLTAGILQRVLSNLNFVNKDDITRRIDRIGTCADEIDRIVQHMRALLRTDDGGAPTNHNINDLAKDAIYLLRAQLEAHAIRLEMTLIEEDITIHVSGAQFQQVVGGLITNAREALDTVQGTDKTISMKTTIDGDNVMLTIEDNGPGLGENTGRAFDPFFTTKDPGMGMGLGLSLSHTLVTSWGGSLAADKSALGGARLTITLPIVRIDTEED